MPSIYQPRRPRASPLWQIVHHAWGDFRAGYERAHRKTHGPLRHDAVAVVDQFYRGGDLAASFTRLQCPDCGHEKLLAFTCKTRHFCPSCHQRRVRRVGDYQEIIWSNFTGKGGVFSWDLDDAPYGVTSTYVNAPAGLHSAHTGTFGGKNTRDSEVAGNDGEEYVVGNVELDAQSTTGGGTGGYDKVINDDDDILLNLSLDKNKSGLFKMEMQKKRLKENRYEEVIGELENNQEAEEVAEKEAPVRRRWRYLSNRKNQLDYKGAIDVELPIGSEEVESTHRHMLQQRLKIPGAWWKKETATYMAQLRVMRANKEWRTFWQEKAA
ncbi:MAG: ribosomal protein S27E [Pseudoalteromonas tetraodonis]|jgi:ribosomal protein S27E